MDTDVVVSLSTQAMALALKISLPLLLVGLVVGVVISVFQAVTCSTLHTPSKTMLLPASSATAPSGLI